MLIQALAFGTWITTVFWLLDASEPMSSPCHDEMIEVFDCCPLCDPECDEQPLVGCKADDDLPAIEETMGFDRGPESELPEST